MSTAGALVNIYETKNAKSIIKTFFIAKRKQNVKNGMNYPKRDEKRKKKTVM